MAKYLIGALAALVLCSCGINRAYLDVIQGNYYVSRGMYQRAVIVYLRALESGTFEPWIAYNLGNVYNALGETDAALDMWSKAEKADDRELQFAVSLNRGLLFHGLGKYRDAYNEFRHALEIDATALDAKINLEHAQRKLSLSGGAPAQRRAQETGMQRKDLDRILDYVQNKDGQRWFASKEDEHVEASYDW